MQGSRIAKPPRTAASSTRTASASKPTSSSIYHGAPPVKSMRALGKENEELQQQVKELSDALRTANESKVTVKAAAEKHAKHNQEQITTLRSELESLKESSDSELSRLNAALQKACEESKESKAEKSACEEELEKKQKSVADYQSRLERLGIDAISMKDWAQREGSRHKDVEIFEEQIKAAMDELRESNAELEKEVNAATQVAERIAAAKEKIRMGSQTTPEHVGEDEDLNAEDSDAEQDRAPPHNTNVELVAQGERAPEATEEECNSEVEAESPPGAAEEQEADDELGAGEQQQAEGGEEQPAQEEEEGVPGGEEGGEEAWLSEEEALALVAEDEFADPGNDVLDHSVPQPEPSDTQIPTLSAAADEEDGQGLSAGEEQDTPQAEEDEPVLVGEDSPEEALESGEPAPGDQGNGDAEQEEDERFKSLRGTGECSDARRAKRKSFDSAIC